MLTVTHLERHILEQPAPAWEVVREAGDVDRAHRGGNGSVESVTDDPNIPPGSAADDGHVDELPEDLDAAGYVGPYVFPDNNRRRVPGYLYILSGLACLALWSVAGDDAVLVNAGFAVVGVVLVFIGIYHLLAGVDLAVDERDALVNASRAVGFPVGHASAQMGWRGLRSRPTWRILLYSAEEPPDQRGFVLVDGVDGSIVEQVIEANPEDWSELDGKLTA